MIERFFLLFYIPLFLFGGSLKTQIIFIGDPTVSLRTITQSFNSLGYKLEIDSFATQYNAGVLSAMVTGNKPFNAAVLDENLKNEGIRIEKMYSDRGELVLMLNTENAIWNLPLLEGDDGSELKRVSHAQWFRIEGSKSIRIQPPYIGKWYPDIAVYNRSMGVLSSFRATEPKGEFQFELPPEAYYLKISNAQGMKVLKEGMWIESMSMGE